MTIRRVLFAVTIAAVAIAAALLWQRVRVDSPLAVTVRRGDPTATLTASGPLRPVQSITYRSPVAGREVEIKELAAEGTRVNEGDLLVRLETADVDREIERAQQESRQAQMDLEVAQADVQEADAAMKSVSEGEGALAVEEARTRFQLIQKKVERLRREYAQLKPLMDKGFMTREELARTEAELEEAEEEFTLARKRTDVAVEMTHPREKNHAALQLAQKAAQLGRARTRVEETRARFDLLRQLREACVIYARGPGLVVYEDFMNANPRRKIRIGDRVTPSQGIVTLPQIDRMQINGSVSESEVHRVHPDQAATIRVEAFPDLRLTGRVGRVGTLASGSAYRPLEDKRFDLIVELDVSPDQLRPEMTARADIVVGSRKNVLLLPVTAVFERQGRSIVYVVGAAATEARTVELGESNAELVEIVNGLAENDRVALTEPDGASGAPAQTQIGVPSGAGSQGHGTQPH